MFCKYCGNQLPENAKFCSSCGAKVDEEVQAVKYEEPQVVYVKEQTEEEQERGPWKKFARTGMTLGIISACVPFYGLIVMIFGFVFSGLGLKSRVNRGKAITGMCFSAAAIINFILLIALLVYIGE